MASRQIVSNEEFAKWCESLKPCKYCHRKFIGPVCLCETPHRRSTKTLA